MLAQVLIHPKRIQCGSIKAGQEHVDDNQQIDLSILHPVRNIFIVILKPLGRGIESCAKGLVVILDGAFQKIPIGFSQAFGLETFIRKHIFRVFLIRAVAEDGGNDQFAVSLQQLTFKFLIVKFCSIDGGDGENRVEAHDTLTLECISTVAHRFLVKMGEDIVCYLADALGCAQSPFLINGSHLFVDDIWSHMHRADVIDPEGQDIPIIDGINDGVGVQFIPKGLFGGAQQGIGVVSCVCSENWCSCESENMIVLKCLGDLLVHITKLGAMTFIKDQDDMLFVDGVGFIGTDEAF